MKAEFPRFQFLCDYDKIKPFFEPDAPNNLIIPSFCKTSLKINTHCRETPLFSLTLEPQAKLQFEGKLFIKMLINYGGLIEGKIHIIGETENLDIVLENNK